MTAARVWGGDDITALTKPGAAKRVLDSEPRVVERLWRCTPA